MIRALVLTAALIPSLAAAQLTFPGGNIAPGTTWGVPGVSRTVTLGGDVTIPAGVTLTVLPGTTITAAATDNIMRAGGTSLVDLFVEGTLTVQEASGETTTFTGPTTSTASWGGLIVSAGATMQAGSTRFQRMSQGVRVTSGASPTTVTMNNTTFQTSSGCLSFLGSATTGVYSLTGASFIGCASSAAVSVAAGTLSMTSSIIRDTAGANSALYVTGGTVTVDR
ncbi:MAG: hypothetical protein IAE78_28240, partial [Myxococcus sp.]|nr:hypothetical protein [Myxococcus sp.]